MPRIFTVHVVHQFLVLAFIYNRNNLVSFFHIVGADRLIDRRTTVQIMNDKLAQFLFFLRDDATLRLTL